MIPVPCVFYLRPVAALKHLFVSFLSCIKNLLLICMEGCSMGSRWGIRLQALCSWCEYLLPLVNKSGQVCSVCSRHQNHPIIFSSFCSFSIFSSPPSFVPCSFPFRISHYSVTLHPFCLLCDQNCQRFSNRLHLHIRNANLRLPWRQHARTLKDALRICNDNSLVTICTPILGATLPVEWFWITELTDGIQQPAYGKCRHEINH